jgi:hypothetical protein
MTTLRVSGRTPLRQRRTFATFLGLVADLRLPAHAAQFVDKVIGCNGGETLLTAPVPGVFAVACAASTLGAEGLTAVIMGISPSLTDVAALAVDCG